MLKGAIIGFGRVAEAAHAPAFLNRSADFEIVAAADERPDRLASASKLFPGLRAYAKAEELFAKELELDFVDIATPPLTHARLALHALQRRLHVLVEKPLALNLKDLASLEAQSASQRRAVFTVHNWKHAPGFAKLRETIAGGTLGRLRHVELHTLRSAPAAAEGGWRSDAASGGILVDHGWHAFYLLRHLTGQDPRTATCRGLDRETTLFVELEGASALVHLTWEAPFRSNWALVHGTDGSAELRDDQLLVRTKDGERRTSFASKLSAGSAHPDWFEAMLPDFLEETRDPKRLGTNLAEAASCLRLLCHAQQSERLGGRTVALPAVARAEATRPISPLKR